MSTSLSKLAAHSKSSALRPEWITKFSWVEFFILDTDEHLSSQHLSRERKKDYDDHTQGIF